MVLVLQIVHSFEEIMNCLVFYANEAVCVSSSKRAPSSLSCLLKGKEFLGKVFIPKSCRDLHYGKSVSTVISITATHKGKYAVSLSEGHGNRLKAHVYPCWKAQQHAYWLQLKEWCLWFFRTIMHISTANKTTEVAETPIKNINIKKR